MNRKEHEDYLKSITDFYVVTQVSVLCINKHFLGDVIIEPECQCIMMYARTANDT